jgi:hypothetical protein
MRIRIERNIGRIVQQVGNASFRRPALLGQMGKELDASAHNPLQSVRLFDHGLLLLLLL